ncbi:MAG TPA: BamA/TamA family outer membrane protein [Polyangiales bacterium]|nr:BamA/TamA family outer membrane protein [Polyangiales bacterium]
MKRLACLSLLALLAVTASVRAEVYVYPRRPSQTNVRYADFDWKYIDIGTKKGKTPELSFGEGTRLHKESFKPPHDGTWAWPSLKDTPTSKPLNQIVPGGGATGMPLETHPTAAREGAGHAGGVRLYFYERERAIAERAAASIEDSYRYLAHAFGYRPGKTFAYFLYASYIEFLQTDLFPLQEGVLGVTSPETLDVTLPYFGDARLFADVSTHELAHEFTIQKVQHFAARADVVGDPLSAVPLWFVEGLAEYYAKRGIDQETEMLVRDVLLNPNAENGYVLGSFWEDRYTSGLWTYKVGQARCAFLEETYGKGTIQRILEETPRLYLYEEDGGVRDFGKLVAKVTGASTSAIAARFERWIKKRAFQTFLDARHDRGHFTTLHKTNGIVQAMRTAPSGELVMYRSIEADTGVSKLFLFDRRSPSDDVEVVADDRPGFESLHPVAGQNFALTDHELAFVSQLNGEDVIYYQGFVEAAEAELCEGEPKKICGYDVDLTLGSLQRYEIGKSGIDAVESIALSPDGQKIAFVGLSAAGQRDLFMLTRKPGAEPEFELLQLTNDVFAEREVTWGPDGIVYTSDATGHGKYNLFQLSPDNPRNVKRLTSEPRDQMNPAVLQDGTVMFVAYDARGANVYSVKGEAVHKETDVATGLFDVSPGPDNSIWALHHYSAERNPVRIARKRLLGEATPTLADQQPPEAPRSRSLLGAQPYKVLSFSNWELGSIFLLAGVSGEGSVMGQIMASANDRLRDHGIILSVSTYGELTLTDAQLTYVNESQRLIWGMGLFNDLRSRIDRSFQMTDALLFTSWERYFGVQGLLRYPFTRFTYVQGSLSVGGADYFLLDDTRTQLGDEKNVMRDVLTPWLNGNKGMRFQTEASLSLGYTSVGLQRSTGPIRGSSILGAINLGVQPFDDMLYNQARVDAEHYFRIIGPVNLSIRGGVGGTVGSQRAPQYYLSSFHTLRGVPFGDTDFLLGRNFVFATAELQFPIIELSSFPLIDLEGVLAMDAGAVADEYTRDGRHRPLDALWEKRVLDFVFGVNVGFGPIVIAVHFGQPIDTGDVPVPNDGDLTFNLSLNWRYQ